MMPHWALFQDTQLHGAMAIAHDGWDLGAPDDAPIRCLVLLAPPQNDSAHHVAVLAAFARLFVGTPDVRAALLAISTPEVETNRVLRGAPAQTINYAFEHR